jgi:hypothetical protein
MAASGRAAAHREVVAADHDWRESMRPRPNTKLAGWRAFDLVVRVLCAAGECADLVEAVGIEQRRDPLAHCQPPGIVLALDLIRPAHLPRQRLAPPQFLDVALPTHLSTPRSADYSIAVTKGGDMGEIKVPSELNAIVVED